MDARSTALQGARSAVARAGTAPAAGKNVDGALYALDADGGCTDPAFAAHLLPLCNWALALRRLFHIRLCKMHNRISDVGTELQRAHTKRNKRESVTICLNFILIHLKIVGILTHPTCVCVFSNILYFHPYIY